jgi:hypothetical protein
MSRRAFRSTGATPHAFAKAKSAASVERARLRDKAHGPLDTEQKKKGPVASEAVTTPTVKVRKGRAQT